LDGRFVTSSYFNVLAIGLMAGRPFLQSDYREPGGFAEVILGYKLWTDQFHSDAGIVGKRIVLDSQPFSVIGIAPKVLEGTDLASQVWVCADALSLQPSSMVDRRDAPWLALARLKSGVPPSQALQDIKAIASALEREHPADNAGKGFRQDLLSDFIHKTNSG